MCVSGFILNDAFVQDVIMCMCLFLCGVALFVVVYLMYDNGVLHLIFEFQCFTCIFNFSFFSFLDQQNRKIVIKPKKSKPEIKIEINLAQIFRFQ